MARKVEFSIVDHGIDGEQYFPGAGVAFTRWTEVVTGIGDSAREAAEDAFEMMAESIPVSDEFPVAALAEEIRGMSDKDDAHEGCEDPDSEDHAGCEMHHYVSIFWRYEGSK